MVGAPRTGTRTPAPSPMPTEPPPKGDEELHDEAHRLVKEGVRLLKASGRQAEHEGRRIAGHLETLLVVEPSANPMSAEDPAEAMRRALRDAVVFEMRRIARVIAGRITRLEPPRGTPGETAFTPPARLEVDLETEDDRRTVQLEDAWAWNLHESGAKEGDIVQIDRDHPLVTLRPEAGVPDGRVLDERDHRLQVSLGAIDRAHAAAAAQTDPEPGDEDPDEAVLSRAARSHPRMLATGERSPTGAAARALTDSWVRRRLSGRHTRLAPGVLLVLDAGGLPERAAAALSASRTASVAPWVLLADDDPDRITGLAHRWRTTPGAQG